MTPCCPPKAFDRIEANWLDGYGLLTARTDCDLSNSNQSGKWERAICPCNYTMVAIQVYNVSGYALADFRIKCVSS